MADIRTDKNTYMLSHGTSPRGYGRWGFTIGNGKVIWITGAYGPAHKEAIKQAKAEGATSIKVMP